MAPRNYNYIYCFSKSVKTMTINPFIPIPVMAVICVLLLVCKRKGVWPYIRQIIMVLLIFAINLRIMIPNDEMKVTTYEMKANVIFVIDDTISMVANDMEGGTTRLDAVTKDCGYIIDNMMGARFSVIDFHNISNILCPFNDDVTFIKSIIDSIYPLSEWSAKGTDLSICKPNMLTELKSAESNGAYTVVFFISDGEDNQSEKDYGFDELAEYIDDGAVLGYGTERGGEMYVKSYWDDEDEEPRAVETYDPNLGYTNAISKIDEKNLKDIAKSLGVQYIHMEDSSQLDSIIEHIIDNIEVGVQEKTEQGKDDTYYFFVIALLLMVIVECFFTKKQLSERRI